VVPFVFLPRAVLLAPPLRHRGDAPESGLTVFELAVAGACIMVARQAAADDVRIRALQAGKAAIETARAALNPAKMHSARAYGLDIGDVLAAHGSAAFADRVRAGERQDTDIEVEVSRRALLTFAGLTYSARATSLLGPTLHRLTRRLGKFAPVLANLDVTGRALRFVVHKEWLPRGRFGRVPWPPPTRRGGATAAALWLLLNGADARPAGRATLRTDTLVARLGLSARSSADVRRALDRAEDICRRHGRALGVQTFELLPIDDGERVRIATEQEDEREDEREDEQVPRLTEDYEYDGPTADEIEETRAAAQYEIEREREAAARRPLEELRARLARLRGRA
jgi:hypothetical protein